MIIYLNGKEINIETTVTVQSFIEKNGYKKERIAVEINEEIVPKNLYDDFIIKENDKIEVLSFVGGG